ncbi:MAG: CHAT domain-containing protein [Chloroflexota bacterium]
MQYFNTADDTVANLEPNLVINATANFDITIRGSAAPYSLTAQYDHRTAEGTFTHDCTQPLWQDCLAQLAQTEEELGHERLHGVGSELFRAVMQDAIRDLWVHARTDLEAARIDSLRIRLMLQPPAVASLPWESLYDADRHMTFAATGKMPLIRVENSHQHVGQARSIHAELPIRILLAIPDDPTKQIDTAKEIDAIHDVFTDLGPNQVQLEILQGKFNIIDLRKALERHQSQILHVVCHGQPEGLLFWQRGEPVWVTPDAMHTTLERTTSVKLVLLNACLAGQSSEREAFATVGPQLLQAGIPAVIAMQFAILDDDAVDFARYLYEELLTGPSPGVIDVAVGYARSNLYVLNSDRFGYGTPVLWLNAEDGKIFDLGKQPPVQPSTPLPNPVTSYNFNKQAPASPQVARQAKRQAPPEISLPQVPTNRRPDYRDPNAVPRPSPPIAPFDPARLPVKPEEKESPASNVRPRIRQPNLHRESPYRDYPQKPAKPAQLNDEMQQAIEKDQVYLHDLEDEIALLASIDISSLPKTMLTIVERDWQRSMKTLHDLLGQLHAIDTPGHHVNEHNDKMKQIRATQKNLERLLTIVASDIELPPEIQRLIDV